MAQQETPRDVPNLQVWNSPLLGTLQSRDARSLQNIFASLTDYLKNVQTTISSNYYNLTIGSVAQGVVSASITGTFPEQVLNLTLPVGPTGATGAAGPAGPQGPSGYSTLNLDGGFPDSVYGGDPIIDAGSL
jgi:hypothetical protein